MQHIDIVFTDIDLPTALTSKVLQALYSAFDAPCAHYAAKSIAVSSSKDAADALRKEKMNSYIRAFAAIVSEKNAKKFGEELLPNNIVAVKDIIDEDEVQRVSKQVVWVLSDFGREKKNMTSSTFVISDTHFCHDNIIKYCNRPYASAAEMNEDMIAKWNAVVKENDIVWHLGDFSFGSKDHVKEILSRLNGKVNLVMGNHDHQKLKFYYDCGFHRVYDKPVIVGNFYILSHAPLQWIQDDGPYANIFGHVHDQALYKTVTKRSLCACVERWNYTPVSWERVQEELEKADKGAI